jgi:hypothetical protein
LRRALDVLLLAGLAVLFHWKALLGGEAYFHRDVENFLYERLIAFKACLAQGSLPLWNPYPAFGEPMLGIANAQFAYPTTWLAAFFSPETTQALIVTIHTFLAGFGVYCLARELSISRLGALVAGGIWSVSGVVQSAVNQANVLVGTSMIAWVWLGFARWERTRKSADAALAGLAIAGCLLGGSPESALMACVGAGMMLVSVKPPLPTSAVPIARALLLALGIGIGLSAVQWLPTAALARGSVRSQAVANTVRTFWSNHPASLAQVVLPIPLDELPLSTLARQELFEGREPLLESLYIGLAAAGLAATGLLAGSCRQRLFLAVASFVGFALSLGRFSVLWDLVNGLPLLSLMRYPSRFAILGALPLAILAGAGVDALREPARRRVFIAAGLALGALLLFAVALARPEAAPWRDVLMPARELGQPWATSATVVEMFRSLHLAVVFALPTVAALLARGFGFSGDWTRGLIAAAGIAAVADVAVAERNRNPTLPRALLNRPAAPLAPIDHGRPNRTFVLEYRPRFALRTLGRPFAVPRFFEATPERSLGQSRMYPAGALGRFGGVIESVPVDIPLLRRANVEQWVGAIHALAPTVAFARMLELSGIEYAVTLHDTGAGDRLELLRASPGVREQVLTWKVRSSLPRAFAAQGVRVVPDGQVIQTLIDETLDPLAEIALPAGLPAPPGRAGTVRITQLGFDRVILDAQMDRPGHVVLLESWYPGWQATVDGHVAPLLRANLTFRAVPVPAGHHVVEMVYRPAEVTLGATLSAVTLVLLSAAFIRSRRAPIT